MPAIPSLSIFVRPLPSPRGLPFMILPSAGAPGQIKVEGAACCGSVQALPLPLRFRGCARTPAPAAPGGMAAGAADPD